MLIDPAVIDPALRQVASSLWRRGELGYKLDRTQKKIADALLASSRRKFFLLCSRRLGKSYMLLSLAFGLAIRKPGARILFLAPTGKLAAEIATDLAVQLLADCPADLRPEYYAQSKEFHFKRSGSILRLKGVNGERASDLRGLAQDLIILDECGIMDSLESVVSSVCMPMTMTTGGQILLATTPPESPGHDSVAIYEDLAGAGAAVRFTLADSDTDRVSFETKCEFLCEAGEDPDHVADILRGTREAQTTTALREYFCQFVTDASKAVVPEFTSVAQREIVREHARPEFFDAFTGIDPGMEDRTGILYGYWDFLASKIVIEDESLLHRANTKVIADCVRGKELELWPGREPRTRVSDVDKRLISDLAQLHGIKFRAARKEDSLGAVNLMRNDVHSRTLVINPRCVHLIRQLRNATWNNAASDFARAGERSMDGHYDLLAALKYITRTIDRTRNPYPENYYAIGGRLGPAMGSQYSIKRRARNELGLYPNTPLGRKLAKVKKF